MGLRWRLRVLEHPRVKRFSAAKTLLSKSVPKMAVVRKFKGLNLNCGHWDPQKAHLSQNDVF